LLGLLLLGVMVLVAACSSAAANTVVTGDDVRVLMFDNRFQYIEIHIPVGGSVEWVGAGRLPHNAVAADGSWSTESVFGSLEQLEGDAAVLTYDQPGEWVFFCTLHGNAEGDGMAGVLVVGGEADRAGS
jgi:plastocyanin